MIHEQSDIFPEGTRLLKAIDIMELYSLGKQGKTKPDGIFTFIDGKDVYKFIFKGSVGITMMQGKKRKSVLMALLNSHQKIAAAILELKAGIDYAN